MPGASRVALARLAEQAALEDPGVDSLDSGSSGLRATRAGTERIGGVVCAAVAGGGYSIDLYLVCLPEDLHALGERVRATVLESAEVEGMSEDVGSVSIHVEDVVEPSRRPA